MIYPNRNLLGTTCPTGYHWINGLNICVVDTPNPCPTGQIMVTGGINLTPHCAPDPNYHAVVIDPHIVLANETGYGIPNAYAQQQQALQNQNQTGVVVPPVVVPPVVTTDYTMYYVIGAVIILFILMK